MKISNKINTTGDKSIPPKYGKILLIGLKNGSVKRFRKSAIIYINLWLIFIILKPMSQLINADKIIAQIKKSTILLNKFKVANIEFN